MLKLWQMALLATCLCSVSTGCQGPKVKLIDPTTTPERVTVGQQYNPPCDGYFVPDATLHRVLDQVTEKDVFGQ